MSKVCRICINEEVILANRGDLLLDAALMNGIELPHDCRSGYCGTCRVRVLEGQCFDGRLTKADVVYACQCHVISDMVVEVEQVPDTMETSGWITDIARLAPEVLEVCVEPSGPVDFLPGQYLSVQFRGYPARCYSPTAPLDWPDDGAPIRFHVRQVRDGYVSSALGTEILRNHRVKLRGPFGSAYFRPNHVGRLVLISSGTGFAPIWSIAEAAIWERPTREMVLIAGARSLTSFYMIPALCRLALFPRVTITSVISEPQTTTRAIQHGRPTDYLPALSTDDVVYAGGAPAMVRVATEIAMAAGIPCFSDPFDPQLNGNEATGFLALATRWIADSLPICTNTIERKLHGLRKRAIDPCIGWQAEAVRDGRGGGASAHSL